MANLTIHGVSVVRFQVREDIEKRLPDFSKYVDPQKAWFAMGVPQQLDGFMQNTPKWMTGGTPVTQETSKYG